jgi:hypothetical protein
MQGVQKLQLEIQANYHSVKVLPGLHWLGNPRKVKERYCQGEIQSSSMVFSVKGTPAAQTCMAKGVLLGSSRYRVELYIHEGPNSQYTGCLKWRHIRERCPTPKVFRCTYCTQSHPSAEYKCKLLRCESASGSPCTHMKAAAKCANCHGQYFVNSNSCPYKKEAIATARRTHTAGTPPSEGPTPPNPDQPPTVEAPSIATMESVPSATTHDQPPPQPQAAPEALSIQNVKMSDAEEPSESEW